MLGTVRMYPNERFMLVQESLSPLAEEMAAYVRRVPGTSFVELEQVAASHGVDPAGDLALELDGSGIVFWVGMSELFIDAVQEMIDARAAHMVPTVPLDWFADGKFPSGLLVARRPTRNGYREWAPVVFNPGPLQPARKAG
jgi:hypothetical protein